MTTLHPLMMILRFLSKSYFHKKSESEIFGRDTMLKFSAKNREDIAVIRKSNSLPKI